MSELNERVLQAKNALMIALGDNYQKYLNNMKYYFRRKFEYAEFDLESRKLLPGNKLHLHNELFAAIMCKIGAINTPQPQSLISSSSTSGHHSSSRSNRKRKRSSRTHSERAMFEPYDFFEFLAPDPLEPIRPPSSFESTMQMMPTARYCVQELFLPNTGFIYGRFQIGAWEIGLVQVDDTVAEYMCIAVQFLLKNLISSIIMKRKHYKVTGEGSYYYDVGAPIKDPFLRNTVTRQKIDDGPLVLDKEITSPNFMRRSNDEGIFLSACEEVYPQKKNLITLKDLQRAFNDKNMIASHSVYSVNRERLTQMLH
ncbi:transcriptional adapter 1-like [Episyrphus balteatus]|uniref:transcriptional adapter 1-like n=1 Tax=Episyrphus balteatus TaxID=286459 RepID=UPI0024858304|nr:transcriptional adapter 1-like [Episyrphus balteatus]